MPEPDIGEHIKAIQAGLRRAGREMVLSGGQALARGLFVLAGCGLSLLALGRSHMHMVGLWCAVAALDLATESALYVRLARRRPDKFVTGLERQLLKFLLFVLAAGAALTVALMERQQSALVPGVWILLIGAAYVAVGLFSFSRTWILGLCISAGGAAALFLEPGWSLLILAVTVGLGSIAWGAVLKGIGEHR